MYNTTQFFYEKDGQRIGPLTLNQLKEAPLADNTQVWFTGQSEWKPLKSLPQLVELLSPADAPPPLPDIESRRMAQTSTRKALRPHTLIALLLIVLSPFFYRTGRAVILQTQLAALHARITAGEYMSQSTIEYKVERIYEDDNSNKYIFGAVFSILLCFAFHTMCQTAPSPRTFLLTVLSFLAFYLWASGQNYFGGSATFSSDLSKSILFSVVTTMIWSLNLHKPDRTTRFTFAGGWALALVSGIVVGGVDPYRIAHSSTIALVGGVTSYYLFVTKGARWQGKSSPAEQPASA